jgi:elongator complex protein 1
LSLVASPEGNFEPLPTALPTFCPAVKAADVGGVPIIVALSPLGKLFVLSATSDEAYQVAADCTSFTLSTDFLIYTTTTHESKYAPLSVLGRILDGGYLVSEHERTWESRRVERGSIIVTVVSTTMALILQMPRGNLETIYPRPLVLAGVRRDLDACVLRPARACASSRV